MFALSTTLTCRKRRWQVGGVHGVDLDPRYDSGVQADSHARGRRVAPTSRRLFYRSAEDVARRCDFSAKPFLRTTMPGISSSGGHAGAKDALLVVRPRIRADRPAPAHAYAVSRRLTTKAGRVGAVLGKVCHKVCTGWVTLCQALFSSL